jgi:CheY-like chemotaxis protein
VAENKSLNFQITVAEEVPAILSTDRQRFKQIINNLLSNAFKFTAHGEVKLTIKRVTLDKPELLDLTVKDCLMFSVEDTGIGIPQDKQQVIFEAFQQADGTTSRRYGGTGLGLSISRQLARLLGGEIRVESEEEKGSTFIFYLPEAVATGKTTLTTLESMTEKKKLTETKYTPQQKFVPQPQELSKPLKPLLDDREQLQPEDKFILIVEDDRKFSQILMELAQEKGFKCIVAEDGKAGLQLATEYKPHAVMLDINLPIIDGWAVMEKLKDNPETRHIPVHFISASDQQKDARKMGAIGYLLKPVSMGELGEAFKRIEEFISDALKNLLILVDDPEQEQKIIDLVGGENINATIVKTKESAYQQLTTKKFDCVILDVDAEQGSGITLLESLQKDENLMQSPVIIYAERELKQEEEILLQQCAGNLTIKAVKSPERLLDEAVLFLHQVEDSLTQEKRKMLQLVHNKEVILAHKKVLIVDDDIRNTFALMTFLDGKNMEVSVASNGKEAMTLLEEHPDTDIVLMDIMMPEMDGYEAIRKIRTQPRFRKLPIIALTAKAMKGDKTKCIEAGANDYIAKPVDTSKLISLMRVWLYR